MHNCTFQRNIFYYALAKKYLQLIIYYYQVQLNVQKEKHASIFPLNQL